MKPQISFQMAKPKACQSKLIRSVVRDFFLALSVSFLGLFSLAVAVAPFAPRAGPFNINWHQSCLVFAAGLLLLSAASAMFAWASTSYLLTIQVSDSRGRNGN